jgi:hypothetical protein
MDEDDRGPAVTSDRRLVDVGGEDGVADDRGGDVAGDDDSAVTESVRGVGLTGRLSASRSEGSGGDRDRDEGRDDDGNRS